MRFWRKRQIRLYKYQGGGKRMYLSAASLPAGEAGNMVVWVFQEQITQFHLRGGIGFYKQNGYKNCLMRRPFFLLTIA
jgi:hypothetical protein